MKFRNPCARAALLAAVLFGIASCERAKTDVVKVGPTPKESQADQFAIDVLRTYYLWNDEIEKDFARLDPDTCRNPAEVVRAIRYHADGKEIDKWTVLTEDLESVSNSIQGLGVTYGYNLQLGRISDRDGEYFLVVCYVSKDSPASKAGLKRGDIILTLDGKAITKDNVYDAFNTRSIVLGVTGLAGGYISGDVRNVSLTAVDMYEDPVLLTSTYDVAGKKIGYLVYNGFDLKSSQTLPDVFRGFKSEGIDELIIDLRYNGGGYAFTECLLASMIAPPANVQAGDVFQTEVYNSILTEVWADLGQDTDTYFSTNHQFDDESEAIDVSDANPGISRLYAIVTDGSASASEGLIVGMTPYMDIVLVGRQTYGKYCAGILLAPEDMYNKKNDYTLIKDWGMYVMISKFADRDGNNASIPDGIPVDIAAEDNPLDGYQLGDENETMLRAALQAAGKAYPKAASPQNPYSRTIRLSPLDHGAPKGILVKTGIPNVH